MLFYAGAGMPVSNLQRLEAVAAMARTGTGTGTGTGTDTDTDLGPLWMTARWGGTDTAPAITLAHWRLDRPGVVGLPLPSVRLKLVPVAGTGGTLEMRDAGDHVFPGYRNDPDATAAAFDDDGYYRIGDAGYLLDEADPLQGVVFDGRVAEDFKLTSGTWVSVGTLRIKVVSALAPWVRDVVLTGHDRSEIGLLTFTSEAGRALQASSTASAADTADAASGEITDKGHLNQRRLLAQRAAEVEVDVLYASPAGARVIQP